MDLEPLWRVLVAAGLAIPVGLERELRGKAAGLRTHVVVAVASAALGYVSITAAQGADGNDATRIAAQVVSGIGFMGAGIIFASGGRVHGLTTAAALWSAMAIGLCAGLGDYPIAIALVVVTLLFLGPVESVSAILARRYGWEERTMHVVSADLHAVTRVQDRLVEMGASTRQVALTPFGDKIAARLHIRCRGSAVPEIYRGLGQLDGVTVVSNETLHRDDW